MNADTYDDLPEWIRPGAKLATLGSGYELVIVKKITRTQIVVHPAQHPSAESRFDRTPVRVNGQEGQYRQRGSYSVTLVRRDHPVIVGMRITRIAVNAAAEVATLRKAHDNALYDKADKRSREERALDLLDGIENAARAARRKVEALLDPSTLASAQYAQDLEA